MTFNRYSYPDLDAPLCAQLRARLSEVYTEVPRVSTQLATDPFPAAQVWLTNLGGDETEWGQQDISYQVRVITQSKSATVDLARTVRSILGNEDLMSYASIDNETPVSPIYESVSEWSTTALTPVNLYESAGVSTYYFTLRLHQVNLIETSTT